LSIKKPSRELSIDEVLSQTFDLYSSRFAQFFLPFFVVGVGTGVFNAIVQWWYLMPIAEKIRSITPATPTRENILLLLPLLAVVVVVAILLGIITWVVNTVVNGTAVKFASDTVEKGHASLRESLNITLSRLGSLLGVGIVSGILVILGLLLLIVPGVILAIMFSLVVPAIMIEQKGVFESLGRSRKLVSNRWGKTFILLLLVGIIILVVSGVAGALMASFGLAGSIVSNLITTLVIPILPIATTLLYYSMAARETRLPETVAR